jgi:acetyltransferase
VQSILVYLEGITQARKFMSAARAAARMKPVIVVKPGRFAAGAKTATAPAGPPAEADRVYDAAFRRAGMLRVMTLDELFAALETLSHGRTLTGDRLAILTNGRGLGLLASDALAEKGGRLATLDPATLAALDQVLPPGWSRGNPIDISGDAPAARYAAALERIVADKRIDGCLVLNGPQAVASPLDAAEAVIATLARIDLRARAKIFVSWMGDGTARQARARFAEAGLPGYDTPERAVAGFITMLQYCRNQQLLMRVPPSVPQEFQVDRAGARRIIDAARAAGSAWLDESDSKDLLAAYGIPVNRVRRAADVAAVGAAVRAIGPHVALKIRSPDIQHKSDVGGVVLDLDGPQAAMEAARTMLDTLGRLRPDARIDGFTVEEMVRRKDAAELILGLATDPTFGPVVLFGHGGTEVYIVGDTALALAPLDLVLAHDLIRSTRIHRRLEGFSNVAPADLYAIALTLVKLSQMAADLPEIRELDINPLLADGTGVIALDARIRLDDPAGRPGFAILPYPSTLESELTLADGTVLRIRPIRPEDAPALEQNFRRTRPEDIHSRFFGTLNALPQSLLARLTQLDYDREMALAALPRPGESADADDGFGIVRLIADPDNDRAEFAVIVRSDWHGRGLGRALMRLILDYAGRRGVNIVWGTVLRENAAMIKLLRSLGFSIGPDEDPGLVHAEIRLGAER